MAQTAVFSVGATITYTATYTYISAGKILHAHRIGTPVYDRRHIASPGQAGQGSKNHGYREQEIELDVEYVNTDGDAVSAAAQADAAALGGQSSGSTLVVSGQTFYGVFLVSFVPVQQPKSTGLPSAQVRQEFRIKVKATRLSA